MNTYKGGALFSNDPKYNNEIGNKKTDNDALSVSCYQNASEYFDAGMLVMKLSPRLSLPIISNISFACELFMKAILYKRRIEFKKEHNLFNLFSLLPTEYQTLLHERYGDIPNKKSEDFEMELKEMGDAFVFHRYSHERKATVADFGGLAGFAHVLKATIYESKEIV